jgi:hypothetical protein
MSLLAFFEKHKQGQPLDADLFERALDDDMVVALHTILQQALGVVEARVVRELIGVAAQSKREQRLLAELRVARDWRYAVKRLANRAKREMQERKKGAS